MCWETWIYPTRRSFFSFLVPGLLLCATWRCGPLAQGFPSSIATEATTIFVFVRSLWAPGQSVQLNLALLAALFDIHVPLYDCSYALKHAWLVRMVSQKCVISSSNNAIPLSPHASWIWSRFPTASAYMIGCEQISELEWPRSLEHNFIHFCNICWAWCWDVVGNMMNELCVVAFLFVFWFLRFAGASRKVYNGSVVGGLGLWRAAQLPGHGLARRRRRQAMATPSHCGRHNIVGKIG